MRDKIAIATFQGLHESGSRIYEDHILRAVQVDIELLANIMLGLPIYYSCQGMIKDFQTLKHYSM